jgi:DNA repair exonuclease SbcCD nuclease subunit
MNIQLLNTKLILLGDTHFGIKKFSLETLENQLVFFETQLLPYMQENNISTIVQVGDLFDHRTLMDIVLFKILRDRLFDKLVELDITLIVLTGNHDIAYKNTRGVNSIEPLAVLYPNNVYAINEQLIVNDCGFVPFLVPGETVTNEILTNSKYIFGHFEARGFEIANGVMDKHSDISTNTFSQHTNIQAVFSGHYHIPNMKGLLKYLGTPYQLSWGDSGNTHGFYVVELSDNSFEIDFIPNFTSKQYVKIWYDNCSILIGDRLLSIPLSDEQWGNVSDLIITNAEVKLYLQGYTLSEDNHSDYLTLINLLSVCKYSIIDNRDAELQEQITTNVHQTQISSVQLNDTTKFVLDFVEINHPELLQLLKELLEDQQ